MRRGLSLLELLLTIALLLSVTGLAMPSLMGRLARAQAKDEVDRSLSLLLNARSHAIESAEPVRVVLTDDPSTLWALVNIMNPAVDGGQGEAQPAPGKWSRLEVDAGVRLQGEVAGRLAVFLPDGSAMVEGPLHFTQAGTTIVIEPWSGLPSVQPLVDAEAESAHAAPQETADEAALLDMPTPFASE